jgi:hypothetical protein
MNAIEILTLATPFIVLALGAMACLLVVRH